MRRIATMTYLPERTAQIAEFHFSPLEHAAFAELQEDVELDALLDRIFHDEGGPRSTPT